ncbi:MAG TPA: hypothetical protein VEQ35_00290 [Beijerinckia sp.]|nr:hypothetical protein [Beijerinckia sp.]
MLADSWARHLLREEGIPLRVRFLINEESLDAISQGNTEAGVITLAAFDWYQTAHKDMDLRIEEGVGLVRASIMLLLWACEKPTPAPRISEILRSLM